jgi:hypothetical protein
MMTTLYEDKKIIAAAENKAVIDVLFLSNQIFIT